MAKNNENAALVLNERIGIIDCKPKQDKVLQPTDPTFLCCVRGLAVIAMLEEMLERNLGLDPSAASDALSKLS